MRKVYELDGDICAHCAAKIENTISKMDGVSKARVNAMTLKFTLNAQDEVFDQVLEESLKTFAKVEPDCEVLV